MRRRIGHVVSTDDDPPSRRLLEAGDEAEGRRLAAAGGAEQREELSLANLEIELPDGLDVAEALAETLQRDAGPCGAGHGFFFD